MNCPSEESSYHAPHPLDLYKAFPNVDPRYRRVLDLPKQSHQYEHLVSLILRGNIGDTAVLYGDRSQTTAILTERLTNAQILAQFDKGPRGYHRPELGEEWTGGVFHSVTTVHQGSDADDPELIYAYYSTVRKQTLATATTSSNQDLPYQTVSYAPFGMDDTEDAYVADMATLSARHIHEWDAKRLVWGRLGKHHQHAVANHYANIRSGLT